MARVSRQNLKYQRIGALSSSAETMTGPPAPGDLCFLSSLIIYVNTGWCYHDQGFWHVLRRDENTIALFVRKFRPKWSVFFFHGPVFFVFVFGLPARLLHIGTFKNFGT